MSTSIQKLILGDEYDDVVRESLKKVIIKLGGRVEASDWGVGGSQEIETIEVDIDGRKITIESETYVGLSITGESDLVNKVQKLVTANLESDD